MSEPNLVQTAVTDLEIGMYVAALDRPWMETPFLVQGFYIDSHKEIEELEKHCKFVYVDIYRSKVRPGTRSSGRVFGKVAPRREPAPAPRNAVPAPRNVAPVPRAAAPAPRDAAEEAGTFRSRPKKSAADFFPHRKLKPYEDAATFTQELAQVKPVYAAAVAAYRRMTEQFRASGKLDLSAVRDAANPLVESMVRNPDAGMWLARIRDENAYPQGHPVGAAIWALALGRQLGLPKVDLQRLALGALLFDIGKLKMPEDLLRKMESLSGGEFHLVKLHVQFGLEMLSDSGLMNRTVTDMVEFHHERYGGHGYPAGLKGDDIPIFGRIAGIVDCFDAITSRRPYSQAVSPAQAVKKMYAWRDIDFEADIVGEFIQAIGVFPAGTLLELSNGQVGLSMAGYRTQRLRPQVLLVLDRDKNRLPAPRVLDLATVTRDAEGKLLEIATSLEPGAYGVDPWTVVI